LGVVLAPPPISQISGTLLASGQEEVSALFYFRLLISAHAAYFSLMQSAAQPRSRLTKRIVDAAQSGSAERFEWDSEVPGFGLRVTPAGVKSFVFQYRMRGEKNARRYTIGRYGTWTPDEARERAKELAKQVEAGEHPREAAKARASERAKAKAEAIDKEFGKVVDRWLVDYAVQADGTKRRLRSLGMAKSVGKRLKTKFEGEPITVISASDLKAFFAELPKEQAATRRNLFAYARILWNWAEEHDIIGKNPFPDLKPPKGAPARERVLTDDELALFWRATRKQSYPFAPFFRLLALTGQRRSEVAGMAWSELDRAAAVWRIPGSRTKNHQPHTVPLSAEAVAELAAIAPKTEWPKRGLVFTVTGTTAISGMSRAKSRLDEHLVELAAETGHGDVPAWRVHDLRRTVATGLQRLDVRFEVTEAVLNHVSGAKGGVAGIYQQHDWAAEKRAALDAWAARIAELIRPKLAASGTAPVETNAVGRKGKGDLKNAGLPKQL